MSYQRDMNNIQQMLGILLQLPDPNQMLKASKPLDREEGQIQVIEQGVVQKYKWQGALPSKLRDEKLQLNFDKQANKTKHNSSLLSYSQQINHQSSIQHKRDQFQIRQPHKMQNQSFSVDYRSKDHANSYRQKNNLSYSNYDENFGFNQNQSAFIQKNNFFENTFTPSSTKNRQNQQFLHQQLTPSHNLLSPKNNSFHNNQIRMSISEKMQQQPQESKLVAVKYIGVHNDQIGVLSRKIPMEEQVEKITKCKQIQLERRIKSGAGYRQKAIDNQNNQQNEQVQQNQEQTIHQQQKNKIFINIKSSKKKRFNAEDQSEENKNNFNQETGTTNDNTLSPKLEAKSREKLLNISQQLYDIKENEEGEVNLNFKELYPDSNTDMKKQHQNALRQVLEEQEFQSKIKSPLSDVRMSQDNKKVENTHSTLSSTQQQRYNNNNSIFKNDKNIQLFNTNSSRPNTTANSRNYYNYAQASPLNTQNKQQSLSFRAQSLNQQRRVIQNDPNTEIMLENNQINIDKLLNNTQNHFQLKPQEMPDPSKYDKFLVTKYSLERKLTALKKKREENPNYGKKQFYVVWNNQQINCVNNFQ